MLKIVVERTGASIYGNPFYSVVTMEGTEEEKSLAYAIGIVKDYKKGTELSRNSQYVYTVNNAPTETTKGKRKPKKLSYEIVDIWHA